MCVGLGGAHHYRATTTGDLIWVTTSVGLDLGDNYRDLIWVTSSGGVLVLRARTTTGPWERVPLQGLDLGDGSRDLIWVTTSGT